MMGSQSGLKGAYFSKDELGFSWILCSAKPEKRLLALTPSAAAGALSAPQLHLHKGVGILIPSLT